MLSGHAAIGSSIQPGMYEHQRFSMAQLYLRRKKSNASLLNDPS